MLLVWCTSGSIRYCKRCSRPRRPGGGWDGASEASGSAGGIWDGSLGLDRAFVAWGVFGLAKRRSISSLLQLHNSNTVNIGKHWFISRYNFRIFQFEATWIHTEDGWLLSLGPSKSQHQAMLKPSQFDEDQSCHKKTRLRSVAQCRTGWVGWCPRDAWFNQSPTLRYRKVPISSYIHIYILYVCNFLKPILPTNSQ